MSTVTESATTLQDDSVPTGDVLYEMVDGLLVDKDVSNYTNQIANLLKEHLDPFLKKYAIGKAFVENVFILDTTRRLRRRPDLAVILADKWPISSPPLPLGDCDLIPDLAVEVVSSHDTLAKVMKKTKEYFRHGVTEFQIVIPEGQIVQVFRSLNDVTSFGPDEEIRSTLLPGWSMSVVELLSHKLEAETDEP